MIRKPEVGCEAFFRLPSCKTISPIFLTIYPRIIGYSVCLQESSVPPVPAMFIYYLCKNRMSCFIWMNSVRADQGRIFHPVQHPAPHVFQSAASTTGNITYNIGIPFLPAGNTFRIVMEVTQDMLCVSFPGNPPIIAL